MQQTYINSLSEFSERLNKAPEPVWILQHEGYDYIPVSIVETELEVVFFGLVKHEILSTTIHKEEILLTVRLWYYHPVINEWMFKDGIGAAELDYKAVNPLKAAGALAYSEAIKVAAKKLGKRFGSDLNRDNKGDYALQAKTKSNEDMSPLDNKVKVVEVSETIIRMVAEAETADQVVYIFDGNKNLHSNKEFINLIMNRKKELRNGTGNK